MEEEKYEQSLTPGQEDRHKGIMVTCGFCMVTFGPCELKSVRLSMKTYAMVILCVIMSQFRFLLLRGNMTAKGKLRRKWFI